MYLFLWYTKKIMRTHGKIEGVQLKYFVFIFFFSLIFLGILFFFVGSAPQRATFTWGVTFSKTHAAYLGLDWKQTFLAILDELKVTDIRIPLYWNDIAPHENELRFTDYEWMIVEAEKRDVRVILVLGSRVPRWPECHEPAWLDAISLKDEKRIALISAEVQAFRHFKNISAWQVENEPFFGVFGNCHTITKELLAREIDAVRALDSRPVLVTDSGELSSWLRTSHFGDMFGFTMYRTTWNKWLGYQTFFFRPVTYFRKALIVARLRPNIKKFIGVELQMEPWLKNSQKKQSIDEQRALFTVRDFRKNLQFARNSGFNEHYLWGVEWWYYLHASQGDSSLWNEAKKLW